MTLGQRNWIIGLYSFQLYILGNRKYIVFLSQKSSRFPSMLPHCVRVRVSESCVSASETFHFKSHQEYINPDLCSLNIHRAH